MQVTRRPIVNGTRRRYACRVCACRLTTVERVVAIDDGAMSRGPRWRTPIALAHRQVTET